MLLAGEIDAAVALPGIDPGADPHCDSGCRCGGCRVVSQTGVYPVNHVVVVRESLLASTLAGRELMRCSCGARRLADDCVPYGIDANRTAIELLMRYAAEQGLIPRAYRIEELFVRRSDIGS